MAIKSVKEDKKTVAKVAAKLEGGTIGEKIDRLHMLREKKRAIQKDLDEVEAEFNAVKGELLEDLAAQKVDGSKGKLASANVSRNIVANVKDWDKAFEWIKKNDYLHLFERRISATAFREVLELQGNKYKSDKTGIEPFEKVDIRLTSL